MQIVGKETLSNCCCGNLGESSCEVEKNNFCPVCGKQGTLVKNITVKNMVLNELVVLLLTQFVPQQTA
jgi:hypothetical protein